MKFKQNKKLIFLDPSLDIQISNQKVDIILSPALYWVKKIKLPVKNIRDVKKLLISLFEDVLPKGDYSYYVYKEGEYFYIFAYEDKVILNMLISRGVSLNKINSVYFAQSELNKIQKALKINEVRSIYVKDSIVTIVPTSWTKQSDSLELNNIKLSKNTINLKYFGNNVDNNSLKKIGVLATGFILLLFAELLFINSNIDDFQKKTQQLISEYELKPTMMQNKAILKKYRSIHDTQTKFRQEMSKILKQKNIKSVIYKNKTLKVNL